MTETIYACASGAGAAAIAVYRVSGPGADDILGAITSQRLPSFRVASLRRLLHPETRERVDEALVLRFAEERSYTGELSFEVHIHGGTAVRRHLESALEAAGARLAQPGEFSRRAFLNGQLDMAQAEAVAALIEAESDIQRRQALEVLDGAVGRQAAAWRSALIDTAALLETGIDFVEEGIEETIRDEALKRVSHLHSELREHASDDRRSSKDVGAPMVALIGRPNAGKSSLLNAILAEDAAIVSDQAGTTRDAVLGDVTMGGVRIRLMDTAGIRDASDSIESAGIEKARRVAQQADLRILVLSPDTDAPDKALTDLLRPGDAVFWTKSDVRPPSSEDSKLYPDLVAVSAKDRSAAFAFERLIESRGVVERGAVSSIAGTERRRRLIERAADCVELAEMSLASNSAERTAEDLKLASTIIGELVGDIDHEDVLDALFSRFCIGK